MNVQMKDAPVVNPVVAATGDEGDMNTHMDEGVQMNTVSNEGFVREVAAFPSDDGGDATIGAQLHIDDDGTVHRLLVLNGHYGIDVKHIPAIIDALCAARAMVDIPTQAVA